MSENDRLEPAGVRLVTQEEAAAILDVHPTTVWPLIKRGDLVPVARLKTAQLPREEVEQLAARRATRRPNPYSVTAEEAAAILGVVRQYVDRLAAGGRLPYVETGANRPRRLYRRAQVAVIAKARGVRISADRPCWPNSL